MKFKISDVVQLKSLGPVMTVTYLNTDNSVTCSWFDSLNRLHSATFSIHVLDLRYISVTGEIK